MARGSRLLLTTLYAALFGAVLSHIHPAAGDAGCTVANSIAVPLGGQKGPNASRLIAVAVANCLSASLFFCLKRSKAEPAGVKARVTGTMTRNEKKRLRIGDFAVRIELAGVDDPSKLERCLKLFEDYCVVTDSIRQGSPVSVEVVDDSGRTLLNSAGE